MKSTRAMIRLHVNYTRDYNKVERVLWLKVIELNIS